MNTNKFISLAVAISSISVVVAAASIKTTGEEYVKCSVLGLNLGKKVDIVAHMIEEAEKTLPDSEIKRVGTTLQSAIDRMADREGVAIAIKSLKLSYKLRCSHLELGNIPVLYKANKD